MAKSTKDRKPTIGGFIPGEVETDFDIEDVNDEKTGKREWVMTSKASGQPFTIPHAYSDAAFWYELGLHAGQNQQPRRGTQHVQEQGQGQGQQTRTPPPKG